ncbi:phosphoribosylanthranilate isomerase [Solibaculum mannosilyticum]|uniref:N-(5'-phosphoribosyl)anthranilate isomerase n=1 Tax=Solibaculum mannosilyticum TaxID=2780922 RepID=A0A7I8D5T3_9FIRM|nr:phosphoribosylanthranilate isomerase [Solibaculum mannosilyticum]BCI61385.1 N-(5'-phosphoribosyl)anthranilate isomerase [Solibaculum mannosilyticum]
MISIKVCGLTRPEDIQAVNRFAPDYVGFVFAPSRRHVSPETAKNLVRGLAEGILPVGVFVNEVPQRVAFIAAMCGLKVIQLHGNEDSAYQEEIKRLTGREVWKAVRVKDKESLREVMEGCADRYLLDAYHPSQQGGCGQTFDWSLLEGILSQKIMLAGGLMPENVAQAVQLVRPYGVDVSSGVETDGYKDPEKIKEFIRIVRGESQ